MFSHRASLNLLLIICPFTQRPASFLKNDPANELDKYLLIITDPWRKKKSYYMSLVDLGREKYSVWKLDIQNRSLVYIFAENKLIIISIAR